jgi:hypothetical protein
VRSGSSRSPILIEAASIVPAVDEVAFQFGAHGHGSMHTTFEMAPSTVRLRAESVRRGRAQ